MRPAEISEDQIIDAGCRLVAEGKTVNGWSLRRALGDRGKPERLAAVWGAQRAAEEPAPGMAEAAPVALPPGVAEAADQARQALIAHFDGIVVGAVRQTENEVKARYKADFDRITAERTSMAENLAMAEASIDETEQRLTDALTELADIKAKFMVCEKDLAVAAERLTQARRDAEEAQVAITDLEGQVASFAAAAQEAQRQTAVAEATTAAAEREAERLRGQVAALTAALAAAAKPATA